MSRVGVGHENQIQAKRIQKSNSIFSSASFSTEFEIRQKVEIQK